MNSFLYNDFIFSSGYNVWRHFVYWSFQIVIWAAFWLIFESPMNYGRQLLNMTMWIPVFILFGYPLVYSAIPHLLLKGKLLQFFLTMLAWGGAGLYIDEAYRSNIFIPLQEIMGLDYIVPAGPIASRYLCMTTSAASPMIIKFFKLWTIKQREWIQAKEERITAELQLLKPRFILTFCLIH